LIKMTSEQIPDDENLRLRLLELMRSGIETREPNNGFHRGLGRSSLFDGSYDWHSCVMAHWCLCVAARTRTDDELQDWLMERLDSEGLAREVQLLMDRDVSDARTHPYDEAWFLRLLAERASHPDPPEALDGWRVRLESRLLDWLEVSPFPEDAEHGCSGAYGSWLFAYLQLLWSRPIRPDATERLRTIAEGRLAPQRDRLTALSKAQGYDFLWLPAVLALIDRTRIGEPAPYDPGPPQELPDSVVVATVHPLGVAITRSWPDAWDAGRGDERARTRYQEHLAHFLARSDLWTGDFDSSSHWLPQYLWIGLWLADGSP
jgi:hypothetical protein